MKLIPIQSVSDIITNSSSEVFMTLDNEFNENFLKSIGVDYVKFTCLDDVRKFIQENSAWALDSAIEHNPYADQDWFIDILKQYHSEDMIWEFFKPMYAELVGKLFIKEHRDCFYGSLDTQEKYEIFKSIRI